ncbi:Uncharacterised protein [Dermatophilus congolensis]|uniref:Uncharacterized protein n=1 Tax=Dermatophilus congolensis TaxID=1863 RepID=A0AA46BNM1_9MICO|nr:Uncharacterised protein [Dermatophilus congolensis]
MSLPPATAGVVSSGGSPGAVCSAMTFGVLSVSLIQPTLGVGWWVACLFGFVPWVGFVAGVLEVKRYGLASGDGKDYVSE